MFHISRFILEITELFSIVLSFLNFGWKLEIYLLPYCYDDSVRKKTKKGLVFMVFEYYISFLRNLALP